METHARWPNSLSRVRDSQVLLLHLCCGRGAATMRIRISSISGAGNDEYGRLQGRAGFDSCGYIYGTCCVCMCESGVFEVSNDMSLSTSPFSATEIDMSHCVRRVDGHRGSPFLLLELCGPCGLLLVHCTHIVLATQACWPTDLDVFAQARRACPHSCTWQSRARGSSVLLGDQLVPSHFRAHRAGAWGERQCGLTRSPGMRTAVLAASVVLVMCEHRGMRQYERTWYIPAGPGQNALSPLPHCCCRFCCCYGQRATGDGVV